MLLPLQSVKRALIRKLKININISGWIKTDCFARYILLKVFFVFVYLCVDAIGIFEIW